MQENLPVLPQRPRPWSLKEQQKFTANHQFHVAKGHERSWTLAVLWLWSNASRKLPGPAQSGINKLTPKKKMQIKRKKYTLISRWFFEVSGKQGFSSPWQEAGWLLDVKNHRKTKPTIHFPTQIHIPEEASKPGNPVSKQVVQHQSEHLPPSEAPLLLCLPAKEPIPEIHWEALQSTSWFQQTFNLYTNNRITTYWNSISTW